MRLSVKPNLKSLQAFRWYQHDVYGVWNVHQHGNFFLVYIDLIRTLWPFVQKLETSAAQYITNSLRNGILAQFLEVFWLKTDIFEHILKDSKSSYQFHVDGKGSTPSEAHLQYSVCHGDRIFRSPNFFTYKHQLLYLQEHKAQMPMQHAWGYWRRYLTHYTHAWIIYKGSISIARKCAIRWATLSSGTNVYGSRTTNRIFILSLVWHIRLEYI